jgi:hypothetical protein
MLLSLLFIITILFSIIRTKMSDTHSLQDPFDTPDHAKGSSVIQQLTSIIHGFGNANDDQEPDAKRAKYLKITPAQLSQLITACSTPGI